MGTPNIYVYPSDSVELDLELAPSQTVDARPMLTGLAEVAVGRLVKAGLPVAPTPVPSLEPGTGACSILTTDEASVALGGAAITQTLSEADSCAYLADGTSVAVFLEIQIGDEAANAHQGVAGLEDQFELDGMPAAQADMGTASIVVLLPDDETAVQLTVNGPEGSDAHASARTLAELVAPRVKAFLGQ